MNGAWNPDIVPENRPLGGMGWARAIARLLGIVVIIYGLIPILLLAKLAEALAGRRFASAFVVQIACKGCLRVLGFRVTIHGRAMRRPGALVSNHCSWLDMFAPNGGAHVFFISKA